jgi:lipopolysaccharide/colanic/teichoic acid biosynthesis glycosyltransferase
VFTLVAEFLASARPERAMHGNAGVEPLSRENAPAGRAVPTAVVTEDVFADVLMREQRRADRFEQPSLLVVVTAASEQISASAWKTVIAALNASKREIDVVGWLRDGMSLGLLLTDFRVDDETAMRKIRNRVYDELATRVAPALRGSLALRFQTVGPSDCDAADAGAPSNRLLGVPLHRASNRTRETLKRALDIVGSLFLLLAIAPMFLAIAVLIKLTSRGPVFFRQVRVGEAARPFTMLKFRSMHVNADSAIHRAYVEQFITAGAAAADATRDAPFKIVNDPRVTRIGSFLRKTSLDELPQLWNVVRGDMSLVGPRPPLAYEVAQYKPWHRRRVLDARPGMTGLWQVTGRSRTTFDEMVRLDLRYARNYSAWMDIKILLATPRAVVSGKGAC